MTVLDFPDIIPSTFTFGITFNTQINVSPLSNSVQTIEIPGARWTANMSFSNMEAEESRVLSAFLARLRGSSGRFKLKDFTHPTPRGSNLHSIVTVNGASQTGNSINTSGWTASQTGALLVGDYIQFVNNELKIVTADVTADGSGDATITFEPPIRTIPGDGNTITTTACETIMLLESDSISWATDNNGLITNISFNCIEGF
jgi:hypothetical protein